MRNFYKELGVENILLVEEDSWSRESLSTFFRIVGCRMHSAANAVQAIDAMSRERFDLVLCEYQLPGVNGLALLEMAGSVLPDAVKLLFTSYPVEKLAEDASRAGIHAVIRKPFTMETLEDTLRQSFPRGRQGGLEPAGAR